MFITVEGEDGCGKTTLSKKLVQKLNDIGIPAVWCRAPDGPIRDILLKRDSIIDDWTELLLFLCSLRWGLVNSILPALATGSVVVLDRFTTTTIAYQGAARGLGEDTVRQLINEQIHWRFRENTRPDHSVFVVCDEDTREQRLQQRGNFDHMDQLGLQFRQKVAQSMRQQYVQSLDKFLIDPDSTMSVSEIENNGTEEELEAALDDWITVYHDTILKCLENRKAATTEKRRYY